MACTWLECINHSGITMHDSGLSSRTVFVDTSTDISKSKPIVLRDASYLGIFGQSLAVNMQSKGNWCMKFVVTFLVNNLHRQMSF